MLLFLKMGYTVNCKSVVTTLAEVTLSYMHRSGVFQKTVIHLGSKAAVIILFIPIVPEDYKSFIAVI